VKERPLNRVFTDLTQQNLEEFSHESLSASFAVSPVDVLRHGPGLCRELALDRRRRSARRDLQATLNSRDTAG
jgi:hypothetical protein